MTKLHAGQTAPKKEHPSRPALRQQNRASAIPGITRTQRTIGNQAMQKTLQEQEQNGNRSFLAQSSLGTWHGFGPTIVRFRLKPASNKATINETGDRYEQEADRAAEQVMSLPLPNQSGQRNVASRNTDAACDSASKNSSKGGALASETRQFFEPRFGFDFADVRVHTDHSAGRAARSLAARACTVGKHISFADGEYQPSTRNGRQLLAHELAHVVQQSHDPLHTRPHTLAASLSRVSSPRAQRKLIATGDAAGFAALANSIIAVQWEIRVSASGEVSIHATNIQGPPTRDAQELLSTLRTVINDPKTTSLEFIRGSSSSRASDRSVIVGSYSLSRIDLDDVEAFGLTSSHSRQGDNAAAQLIHEITEQYRKQAHGESYSVAHRAGYSAQERLLGATLVSETPMTPVGGDLGEVTTTYRYPDGREVDVITRMNFRTGQIVSVRRVIR
jgi:hypothetical protein